LASERLNAEDQGFGEGVNPRRRARTTKVWKEFPDKAPATKMAETDCEPRCHGEEGHGPPPEDKEKRTSIVIKTTIGRDLISGPDPCRK